MSYGRQHELEEDFEGRILKLLVDQGLRAERQFKLQDLTYLGARPWSFTPRADVVILHPDSGEVVELMEVKVSHPLAGIGQLLGYEYFVGRPVQLTLVVLDFLAKDPRLSYACTAARVRLWPLPSPKEE